MLSLAQGQAASLRQAEREPRCALLHASQDSALLSTATCLPDIYERPFHGWATLILDRWYRWNSMAPQDHWTLGGAAPVDASSSRARRMKHIRPTGHLLSLSAKAVQMGERRSPLPRRPSFPSRNRPRRRWYRLPGRVLSERYPRIGAPRFGGSSRSEAMRLESVFLDGKQLIRATCTRAACHPSFLVP